MLIESIRHKALRRFAETGNPRGLPGDLVQRLRLMLLFLDQANSPAALLAPPNYDAHQLTGDRAGTWSLTVTRNWRMTFAIDAEGAIIDLDLEDYH
ncbi:type II toxin-antitoxin system RelE/ParE family toxin [Sphingomonas sp. BK069]|uniref:type II toxin-antitoxin system RelE/ParE family toxin n=1 Tax=Sphingomonas sp. BK069 TaxID=2586979 RepID=UPI00160FBD5C|nr:type II toxin-antitoxin system RelE/ParE family toxin [Sphingomonas sp. BK069]MBB3346052.1 proteic killer suppression protein [Sphingomonas sp. BK069]